MIYFPTEKESLEKNAILHNTNNSNNNNGNNDNTAAAGTADLRERSDDRLMVLAQEFLAYKEASERIMSDLKTQLTQQQQQQQQHSSHHTTSSALSSSGKNGEGIKPQGNDLIDHFSSNNDSSRSLVPPSSTKAVVGQNSTEYMKCSSQDSMGGGSPRTRFIIPAAVDDLRMPPPHNDGIDDEQTTI